MSLQMTQNLPLGEKPLGNLSRNSVQHLEGGAEAETKCDPILLLFLHSTYTESKFLTILFNACATDYAFTHGLPTVVTPDNGVIVKG